MKKLFSMLLVLSMLLTISTVVADDLGVQIIGGDKTDATPMSLDDLQINAIYIVDDDVIAVPREFLIVDCFAQFGSKGDYSYTGDYRSVTSAVVYAVPDVHSSALRYASASWCDSGDGAQYAWFQVDLTNVNSDVEDLTQQIAVKCIYRNEYEFGGWIRQIDYNKISKNYGSGSVTRYNFSSDMHPRQIVMHPDNVEPIGYMSTGNYVFGCTLPNYVIEDKKSPLRFEIKIGDNELTYHIRK